MAFAGPFAVVNGCYSNILRAEGESIKAMMGQLIGNSTNILLDPVMIVGLGMNTKGAAIATVIGNLIGTIYYVWYFYRKKSMLSISIRDFTVKDGVCSRVLAIGIPASLNVLFMAISHIILNKLIAGYGNLQLAGVGVATNLLKIPGTICIGFGQGIQPLVGYCFGSGDWVRCKKVIRFSIISGFILSCILCLFSYSFIDTLVGAFLTNENAFDYGVAFAKVMLATCFLFGVFYTLTNVLQGLGTASAALVTNVSRQGLIYIPVLFIMQELMGMKGLVWAQPIADVLSLILVTIIYLITSRKLFKGKC